MVDDAGLEGWLDQVEIGLIQVDDLALALGRFQVALVEEVLDVDFGGVGSPGGQVEGDGQIGQEVVDRCLRQGCGW